jgi:uncharacterized protein YkwD
MKSNLLNTIFFVLIAVSFASCSKSEPITETPTQITALYTYNSDEKELMLLINNYRQGLGLNKLESIDHISYKAEEHDEYMISMNAVSHNFFQNRYQNMVDVLGAKNVSENLAYSYSTSASAFNAWLNSEGHKANIIGQYTHFGISIRVNAEGKKYYTNIFIKK